MPPSTDLAVSVEGVRFICYRHYHIYRWRHFTPYYSGIFLAQNSYVPIKWINALCPTHFYAFFFFKILMGHKKILWAFREKKG